MVNHARTWACKGVVKHSIAKFVDGSAYTNGIESYWPVFECGYHCTYHRNIDEALVGLSLGILASAQCLLHRINQMKAVEANEEEEVRTAHQVSGQTPHALKG